MHGQQNIKINKKYPTDEGGPWTNNYGMLFSYLSKCKAELKAFT